MMPVENKRRARSRPAGALLLLLLILTPALWAAAGEPRFEIETITVEKAHKFSPGIVVAESLLETGRAYTERELREAIYRIVRLPLIINAEFSLRKGSRRGLYELVIEVEEARRWFFGFDGDISYWAQAISIQDLESTDLVTTGPATAGRRYGVGRHGIFFFTLSGPVGTLGLGYTHNNLFQRNLRLSLGWSFNDCSQRDGSSSNELGDEGCQTEIYDLGIDPTFSTWSPVNAGNTLRGALGIPLRGNQSVRLRLVLRGTFNGLRRQAFDTAQDRVFLFEDREDVHFEAAWVTNTLDDPVFPTSGVLVEAGLDWFELSAVLIDFDLTGDTPQLAVSMRSRQVGGRFLGRKHWALTDRNSVSGSLRVFLGRSDVENLPTESRESINDQLNVWDARAGFGHSMLLYFRHAERSWRELRWQNEIEISSRGTSPSRDLPDNPLGGFRVSSGLFYRTTWGVFGLRFSYVDLEGR
jgi:hypothetical protein